MPPDPPVARSKAPHAGRVDRTQLALSPTCGITRISSSPASVRTLSLSLLRFLKVCPCRPHFGHDHIGSNAGFWPQGFDAQQAPVALDEPVSWRPVLRVVTQGQALPFWRVIGAQRVPPTVRLLGGDAHSQGRYYALPRFDDAPTFLQVT